MDDRTLRTSSRYVRKVISTLSTDAVFGNMIDINPEELVGSQPPIIQSFFHEIFPRTSLIRGRKDLGYREGRPILGSFIGKPYIDLERDTDLFLPATLTEEEVAFFRTYYHDLIVVHPSLQTELDTSLYPINKQRVGEVLRDINISEALRTSIEHKFDRFFAELEQRLLSFEANLSTRLNTVYEEVSNLCGTRISDISDLTDIQLTIPSHCLSDLVSCIEELTYIFVIVARGAFYFSGKYPAIDERYFRTHKYESDILQHLRQTGKNSVGFRCVEGFNFLKVLHSIYTRYDLEKLTGE